MANVTLAYRNLADDGTFSGGSWASSLPLTNFQDQQPSKKARSSDVLVASTKFDIDLAGTKTIGLVALIHHNMSQTAQWRVRISDDATFATSVSDSGTVDVWPDIEAFGVLQWGEFNWNGKTNTAEAVDFGPIAFYYISATARGRYIRVEITDTSNADGYVQAGRVFAGPVFQPVKNLSYGWNISFIDDSIKTISRGGQTYIDVLQKRRRLEIPLHSLTEDEAFSQANNMVRLLGRSGDILAAIDLDDSTHFIRQAVYGLLSEINPVTQSGPESYEQNIIIEELR